MAKDKVRAALVDLQEQDSLLRKEYEYEKEAYRQQSERAGMWKKVQQGVCWYPVSSGKTYYNSLNQLVVEVERRADKEVEHTFEHGRPVCFFTVKPDGSFQFLNFSGIISYVQEDRMVVALPSPAALAELQAAHEPGVQLYFDETSYKTMFAALADVMRAKENRLAYLREVLKGSTPAAFRDLFPLRFPWLNPSQEAAVNRVLAAKDVYIVHGPPGTGKTTTLVEAVYETLHRENQVMVCAQSNTAVDWISEKLVDRGVSVLRIGNPTRVNDKMLSFTYEKKFESHPDYPTLWSIRKAIREIQSSFRRQSREDKDSVRNRLSRLRSRATELEIKIDTDLFDEARVIACTLVGSANKVLNNRYFTSLFIDEAAQALEAACWIAISKSDRVILAGDHCQLPPTIKCPEALKGGLDRTLMQKIAASKPNTVSLLKTQYRMHDDIMRFPSRWFYHDELESASEVKDRGILALDTPIVWYDTSDSDFDEARPDESMSRINPQEAQLLVSQLHLYIERIGKERILEEQIDFGLISPYRAQVQYIRKLIRQDAFYKPLRKRITIHTVDGFQGQERDVIMISLVRANDSGQIGFLNDLRRMNVAITRARMKLIIIGDSSTLSRHAFYREFYQYVRKYGLIIPSKEK
ncbi:ATP-dependent RNA/DNA helicase IGHMBP2 [Parabacteroides sp. PF5-5]|uniref:AAA domain-containing protein n=1 Tax=unclassified Parabacteroides TaxID=2649774 RepID=UPI0024759A5E|nr:MULTISPECIES: AAA domain-containing protein [unclassified Parabacteroides]MDH6304123.1 ATP-dependent RNA/DNA helicase IGHMBP2 [Parabacteroides sp. PH5-39]MDH6315177.1 ATP-dependent RNA/DNA helicase IGHMBP2 [Parabacteroides sp. PF5-13]MDH6318822.1 ATP-dependent RNA/DNA helicase IGHMBP2 [Parabacteroides sp. PH5-13]MDH6322551.1 ATP-dependent RNA/DNA helicase IGHMBP2 [Parabacteroides sp. PH5-8]MDH6326297.1 ATP-dependent RNA/DNA helicase IGHMBP2 [Parabacteroides sp. PH5-41]